MAVDVADGLKQLALLGLSLLVFVNLRVHGLLVGQLAAGHFASLLDFGLLVHKMLFLFANFINFGINLGHFCIQILLGRLLEPRFFGRQCRDLGLSGKHNLVVLLGLTIVELVLPRVHISVVMLLVALMVLVVLVVFVMLFMFVTTRSIVAFAFFLLLLRMLALVIAFFAVMGSLRSRIVGRLLLFLGFGRSVALLTSSLGSILLGLLGLRFLLFVAHY